MINDALRLLRKFNDYSGKELAEKLQISPSYLSEIEKGKKQPSLELVNKYSVILSVKSSTILQFSEELGESKDVRIYNISRFFMRTMKAIEKYGELDE